MPDPGPERDLADAPLTRLLAPLALFAATLAVIIVVGSSLGGEDGGGGGGGGGGQVARTTTAAEGGENKPPRRYVVQPGDSLSEIAAEFGLSVEELLDLNPDVDPQALVTGQKLKLR